MSLTHFFLDKQILKEDIESSNNKGFVLQLSKEDEHHAKVLRLKSGEHIGVVDASGVFYECEILNFEQNLIVKNCQKTKSNKAFDNSFHICLAQGISKGNKFDDIVRACSEIGVETFIPVAFERSVSKLDDKKQKIKIERWKKIAKSAAMQSGQLSIPNIDNACTVSALCRAISVFDCVLIFWEESQDMLSLTSAIGHLKTDTVDKNIAIVIGPEGGIDSLEIQQLQKANKNSVIVSTGRSILRTETAAVVTCGLVKFLLEC